MAIPKSGWGLTPGSLEKNVTRALGGKYGSVGKNPTSISDMVRQKYASGLKAKQAKEQTDLARESEANRKFEATRAFGLDKDKFGFTQSDADRKWANVAKDYEQDERRLAADTAYQTGTLAQRKAEADATDSYRLKELEERMRGARTAEEYQRARDAYNDQVDAMSKLMEDSRYGNDYYRDKAAEAVRGFRGAAGLGNMSPDSYYAERRRKAAEAQKERDAQAQRNAEERERQATYQREWQNTVRQRQIEEERRTRGW